MIKMKLELNKILPSEALYREAMMLTEDSSNN